jgi:hypothetical protein
MGRALSNRKGCSVEGDVGRCRWTQNSGTSGVGPRSASHISERIGRAGRAREAAGIVGGKLPVSLIDNELVFPWFDRDDRGIGADSEGFAPTCVANYIVHLVVACPGSFSSGHVLTLTQDAESMIRWGRGLRWPSTPGGPQRSARRGSSA